ncbi:MAG: hypothetical protein H6706_21340 [Myxococcales bacterium]|nr:hypothetical protein [Myxococcales bacterium]
MIHRVLPLLLLAACSGPRVRPRRERPAAAGRGPADDRRRRGRGGRGPGPGQRRRGGRAERGPRRRGGRRRPLAEPLRQLALARLAHAQAEADVARAEVGLAAARLDETHAETAMRHDVAVYDLGPLAAEVEAWRGQASTAREARQQRRDALEAATQAFWQAWRRYTAAGGDPRVLWRDPPP